MEIFKSVPAPFKPAKKKFRGFKDIPKKSVDIGDMPMKPMMNQIMKPKRGNPNFGKKK